MSDAPIIAAAELADIAWLEKLVPEFDRVHNPACCQARAGGRPYLVLTARRGEETLGFKAGYALDADCFYSWIGGVAPAARGGGVARALLAAQEDWVRRQGYRRIRVKSHPRFAAMLRMLQRHGYRTVATGDGDPGAIHFEKTL